MQRHCEPFHIISIGHKLVWEGSMRMVTVGNFGIQENIKMKSFWRQSMFLLAQNAEQSMYLSTREKGGGICYGEKNPIKLYLLSFLFKHIARGVRNHDDVEKCQFRSSSRL